MDDPQELELVRKAITCNLTGCFEWQSLEVSTRIRNDPDLRSLTPKGIKMEVRAFVGDGGIIKQVTEKRPEYSDYNYYYKVVIDIDCLIRPLFVEMILHNSDPDVPVVRIVNSHLQR